MTQNVFTFKDFGPVKAVVDLDFCDGCALCINVCPYNAITLIHEPPNERSSHDRHISINTKLCQGCGMCQGTCPKQGVYVEGFRTEELVRQIGEALAG